MFNIGTHKRLYTFEGVAHVNTRFVIMQLDDDCHSPSNYLDILSRRKGEFLSRF